VGLVPLIVGGLASGYPGGNATPIIATTPCVGGAFCTRIVGVPLGTGGSNGSDNVVSLTIEANTGVIQLIYTDKVDPTRASNTLVLIPTAFVFPVGGGPAVLGGLIPGQSISGKINWTCYSASRVAVPRPQDLIAAGVATAIPTGSILTNISPAECK
jgi:hypothetical protein